jgi:hypothetical protein
MKNKTNKLQYLLVACLLLFTSSSSQISTNKSLIIIWCIVSSIYYLSTQVQASRYLIHVVIILVGISFIYFLINRAVDKQTYLGYFVYIVGAFSTVKVAGKMLPKILVDLVYYAAFISLPLYIFQLIDPDKLFELNNLFGLSTRGNSNSIIFNFTFLHPTRNCGFMWEPGAFAGILIICIYINTIIIQNYSVYSYRNIVLLSAILTTFSTLGYITLMFPLLSIMIHHKKYKYILPFIFALPILSNINFLLPKLFNESNNVNNELYKTKHATEDSQVSVSRSASIAIDFSSFSERPILGYGIDFRTTNAKQIFDEYDENVIRSSGIMNLLLRFGLIGLFIYVYLIFRSFRFYATKSSALIFSLLIVLVLFSNPIDNSPFLFSLFFWMPFNLKPYLFSRVIPTQTPESTQFEKLDVF